jgi:gamma-glutamyltranspeptidase / glutathione hydrolase
MPRPIPFPATRVADPFAPSSSAAASAAAFLAVLALAAVAGSASPVAAQDAPARAPLPVTGRSVVTTTLGIVATSQPLASAAGAQVLAAGGNAIDAAIAANAVLGVTEPMMNGIGGDLFAIVYEAKTGTVHGLNASGWSATGVTAELVASKVTNGRMPQRGVWSITVPGAVAGWDALRTRFGTMAWDDLLAPAIWYAESGFPVGPVTARLWTAAERNAQDAFRAVYAPEGRAPRAGEVVRNPDLARTMRAIAARGARGFYEGATARAILDLVRSEGGTMTAADLSEFRPEWVSTITTDYRGWTIHELPPNSQGIAALMMLDIMKRHPIAEYGYLSPWTMHVGIEAKKLAYADLLRYVGDPRFSAQPVERFLSPAHAESRAALLDPTRANCRVEPVAMGGIESGESETVYLSVIDKDGNIVSLIQSIYSAFGSGLVAPGTGFALHNRGGLFTLEPGRPNTLAPRKRPLHTIIPAFMEKGDVRIGFGIMGGWNQAQAHAQFVSNVADFGMDIQQALEASRYSKRSFDGCDVDIETTVPAATIMALRALGHEVRLSHGRETDTYGYGQAVMSDGRGVKYGASESRHDGAAVPQPAPVGRRR